MFQRGSDSVRLPERDTILDRTMSRGANNPLARYPAEELLAFSTALLVRTGLPEDRARVVAEVLLEGDLLGHTTHGLDLLAKYLREIESGGMARSGEPETLRDRGSALLWDARRLPGPWVVKQAIAEARSRLGPHPTVTVAIRRSHHIGCLQAYLKPVADEGLVIETRERLPGNWLVDADGRPGDDPAVLFGERPGAILPLGGQDLGHKGFALALLVEALTSGLAGLGRAEEPKEWGASVFLQLLDPESFGGREAFLRQTSKLAAICHETPVAAGGPAVRLPGERALQLRERQLREGVVLFPTVLPALATWAQRLEVPLPAPVPA